MKSTVKRLFVVKKHPYDVEAQGLLKDFRETLGIESLESLKIVNRYDVEGISDSEYQLARNTIFSEPTVDSAYDEEFKIPSNCRAFAVEFLPGQYDQRADSAAQCIQLLTQGDRPEINTARVIVLQGSINEKEFNSIKEYYINPVESREAKMEKPETLKAEVEQPEDVATLEGFTSMNEKQLSELLREMGFAMSFDDIIFCQNYFKNSEKRDPSVTEMRMIDTYWSDHCRHTTFLTCIDSVKFEKGRFTEIIEETYKDYIEKREDIYKDRNDKDICLMDIALMAMKALKKQGKLNDLDLSDEINACSIVVNADINGKNEEWLVMFKNETHNHPTEIEPFGGAATCLGGAIRDPLSGRVYVYQAMRVTGSGDPRTKLEDTIQGKLPQKKITTGAASGYSSYGNQIGLATGQVAEIYDEGYVAKRMEIGAVIGAAPRKNVVRMQPEAGDKIILLGGRTGRDGCGGATGSSKAHTEESLITCGAEVQKGNAPTERKIQRLFRNPNASTLIKRCNDFGAGGVSVAIGELADGLEINLDAVPKKYEGLDGTELAISESQERMAVVVEACDVEKFIGFAAEENLEAVVVAEVKAEPRLKMSWRGKQIVDLSREFLNSNGAKQRIDIEISAPDEETYFDKCNEIEIDNLKEYWIKNLQNLNRCSQKGLVERFDSTIGANTVLMPFGGKTQLTPAEGMAAKLPLMEGDTTTGTLMSFGYNPDIAKWSPFHGAVYAVVESIAKIVAMGGDYSKARLTLQEYFEKPGKDAKRWGKPLSALLGAYYAQMKLGTAAIGGKDSMSGSFMDMDVPPTLVSFAVNTVNVDNVISNEFKGVGSRVVLLKVKLDDNILPDFDELDRVYSRVNKLAKEKAILSASSVRSGGIAEIISKMAFGNMIGFTLKGIADVSLLFKPFYGSLILEIPENIDLTKALEGLRYTVLGVTTANSEININGTVIDLGELSHKWQEPLEKVFPTRVSEVQGTTVQYNFEAKTKAKPSVKIAKPRVFIPVFPGTNCEYDTKKVFENAGGIVETMVIKNMTHKDIEESIKRMEKLIDNSQIIMIPGGFSAGDEPEGSGKFIATAFRNPVVSEAVMKLLKNRDGLVLGICNGFQALIKLGLLPFGEIREIDEVCPTLTFNTIGRHQSCLVKTRIASNLSPWLNNVKVGDIHTIAISHGEGRFTANSEVMAGLEANGQIATQYVDLNGKPTLDISFNPNGSINAVEGITSPDGRVFGKMGHSERIGTNLYKNVPGEKDQQLFRAGIEYFG
ncbi:phosphoribosylformylglycinamidine synthase [Ruminiclostridium cellulolyticum]|uniref:Phosphoribosylformylglycinamidine synthase n=1 Tax=Ruminiclostridium cellulolyticum (strain ATCC 35319 / DSM 5812 / JCM 6584 / H10) TaxID=394503 RepID=B8I6I9_RUMCH|nr:phosphoribosylformylglycinamidine synthase [Ruminiclostridium cellulolyticum]ACL74881.1 phosphoribosylformylglycinamidine synthase [Ruminiclostridium cellulolyticum H10]